MLDPRIKACIFVGKYGSISEAANMMYLSKQAVKKQVDSLERELGFTLFTRSSKGLELTPAGKLYAESVEKLSNEYQQLVKRCLFNEKQQKKHILTILQPYHPKLYFEEALMEYNTRYPEILLNVVDTRGLMVLFNNVARLRALRDGLVDVVFAPYEDQYDQENLSFIRLNSLRYCCVMKPTHPLTAKQCVTREDLFPYQVRINTIMDHDIYEYIAEQELTFPPDRIVYAEKEQFGIPSIMSFCLNGGIFLNKGEFLEALRPLVALPFDPPFSVESGIYFRKDPPPHVKNFIDMISQRPWNYDISAFLP